MIKTSKLYHEALRFATVYHTGQKRKYTGEPYISHPVAVAQIVSKVPHDENMLAAALLHDTVEDTPATFDDISTNFGFDVAMLVYFLTDVSGPQHGNREARKALDAQHYARGCARSQTIKVADLIHNTLDISSHDQRFWQIYRAEKSHSLSLLTLADPTLVAQARDILAERW